MASFKSKRALNKQKPCCGWTSLCLLPLIMMMVGQTRSSPLVTDAIRASEVSRENTEDLQTSSSFKLDYGFGGPGLGNLFGLCGNGGGGGRRPYFHPSSYYTFGNNPYGLYGGGSYG